MEFSPKILALAYLLLLNHIMRRILCAFSNIIFIYSLVFIFLKMSEFVGIRVRNFQLKSALKRAREKTPTHNKRRKGWGIIENYYFKNPQARLAIFVLLVSITCFVLGLLARFSSRHFTTVLLLLE